MTDDGAGGYFADWNVEASNFGFSQAAVEAQISDALNDSRGWEQVPPGITFRQKDTAERSVTTVTYQVVETITVGDAPGFAWGIFIPAAFVPSIPYPRIQIEAAHFADLGIPNHEAAHAFFGATHSPAGSDSLMEPYEDPGSEWPSEIDLAQVEAWLATAPEEHADHDRPEGEGGNTLWFPGDLPDYITRWPVPIGCESRLEANVIRGARAALQPVYHTDLDELLAGNGKRFAQGIDCYQAGFFTSPFKDAPDGDIYIGIKVLKDEEADISDFIVGLAEVQIRG